MDSRRFKILCLDDADALGICLGAELANAGYHACYLDAKAVGLTWIARHKPDLIFTDIRSPGMDGFEVLRELRSDPVSCDTPVIMLTGNASLPCGSVGVAELVAEMKNKSASLSAVMTEEHLVLRISHVSVLIPFEKGIVLDLADKPVSRFQGQ